MAEVSEFQRKQWEAQYQRYENDPGPFDMEQTLEFALLSIRLGYHKPIAGGVVIMAEMGVDPESKRSTYINRQYYAMEGVQGTKDTFWIYGLTNDFLRG